MQVHGVDLVCLSSTDSDLITPFLRQSSAILRGTVNDATSFPEPSKSHGSYHWAFERVLSAALIPVMAGAAISSGSAYVSHDLPKPLIELILHCFCLLVPPFDSQSSMVFQLSR